MGWEEPVQRQWRCIVRQWCRLVSISEVRINKRIFHWAKDEVDRRRSCRNWIFRVENRYREVGLDPVAVQSWGFQQISTELDLYFSQQTQNNFMCELNRVQARNGQGLNKLRTYRTFKELFQTEHYVKSIDIRARRRALAQLRCGVAPIRLETGRYERGRHLPVEERCCYICQNAVESELHVIVHCPIYQDLRDDLFYVCQKADPTFNSLSDDRKLAFVLSNSSVAKNSAKILSEILRRRRCLVFNV